MSKFEFIKTDMDDLYVIEPTIFKDNRGFFMETYNYKEFKENGLNMVFVQDNHSKSKKSVLSGIHFQNKFPQGKLVRVTKGIIFDVAVDLRKNSKTYGDWLGLILSEENKRQFYIPEGFGHGFLVLSDEAEFVYKCTNYYNSEDESGIIWNDPDININWPIDYVNEVILSDKDKSWNILKETNIIF
jgi:dTDP-4-dehydrorhamnose 3,5-epimerase